MFVINSKCITFIPQKHNIICTYLELHMLHLLGDCLGGRQGVLLQGLGLLEGALVEAGKGSQARVPGLLDLQKY